MGGCVILTALHLFASIFLCPNRICQVVVYLNMSATPAEILEQNGYIGNNKIGSGSYSKVKRVWNKNCNQYFAAKIIELSRMKVDIREKFLPRELRIIPLLKHENLIETLDIISDPRYVIIIQEYATHGDLLGFIQRTGRIPEKDGRLIYRQLVEAIQYLHSRNIAHRDIKSGKAITTHRAFLRRIVLENILLDKYYNVKLADFGFVRFMEKDVLSTTYCGSKGYAAPEILTETPYTGFACDIWSSGIVLYNMLTGYMPFNSINAMEHTVRAGKYKTGTVRTVCVVHIAPRI